MLDPTIVLRCSDQRGAVALHPQKEGTEGTWVAYIASGTVEILKLVGSSGASTARASGSENGGGGAGYGSGHSPGGNGVTLGATLGLTPGTSAATGGPRTPEAGPGPLRGDAALVSASGQVGSPPAVVGVRQATGEEGPAWVPGTGERIVLVEGDDVLALDGTPQVHTGVRRVAEDAGAQGGHRGGLGAAEGDHECHVARQLDMGCDRHEGSGRGSPVAVLEGGDDEGRGGASGTSPSSTNSAVTCAEGQAASGSDSVERGSGEHGSGSGGSSRPATGTRGALHDSLPGSDAVSGGTLSSEPSRRPLMVLFTQQSIRPTKYMSGLREWRWRASRHASCLALGQHPSILRVLLGVTLMVTFRCSSTSPVRAFLTNPSVPLAPPRSDHVADAAADGQRRYPRRPLRDGVQSPSKQPRPQPCEQELQQDGDRGAHPRPTQLASGEANGRVALSPGAVWRWLGRRGWPNDGCIDRLMQQRHL